MSPILRLFEENEIVIKIIKILKFNFFKYEYEINLINYAQYLL